MATTAASVATREATLSLALAGAPIVLTGSAEWLVAAAHRYGAFAAAATRGFQVRYHATRPAPRDLCSPLEVRNELHTVAGDGPFVVTGRTFSATIDLDRGAATIEGPLALYPLEYVLRYALPALIDDGLLLHGAALADAGRAWACCGPSGCGKSTLASLLPEHAVCDELLAVRRPHGTWRLQSLPYWQARPAKAALAGVHLLRHGPTDTRRRLEQAAAFRELSGLVLWPTLSPDAMARAFDALAALVEAVPVWALEFAPTPAVWDTIRAEEAG